MNNWDKVEEGVTGGPLGLFKWVAIFLMSCVLILGATGLITRPLDKAVERQVMKQSFQYKEGMEQRAAILKANLIELDVMIASNPSNSDSLLKQKRIISAQLRAVTINK